MGSLAKRPVACHAILSIGWLRFSIQFIAMRGCAIHGLAWMGWVEHLRASLCKLERGISSEFHQAKEAAN